MTQHILLVDDDPAVRTSLTRALERGGRRVSQAEDGTQAVARLAGASPDVILTDVRMPGMDGLELLRFVRERAPDIEVVMMTGYSDLPVVAEAIKDGAVDMLIKPIELDDLFRLLDRLQEEQASRDVPVGVGTVPDEAGVALVGRDPRMVDVFKTVGRIARTPAPVLLRGESGTGKELIARAIHAASDRAGEPFVPVNCAALPSTLLESELFGHVRGSFTGATNDRKGVFAQAGRGTVFLDEIGDTSPDFQAKLLRVLQEHEYVPVGAERRECMLARTIAATHRPLEEMVAEGTFREDLYYRLRVVEIVLPPLRERLADIPLLADFLIRKVGEASGMGRKDLTREARQLLMSHDWPGNVRELENCLTRAVLMSPGRTIHPEHILIRTPRKDAPQKLETLEEAERRHVARVLAATGGNKSEAARVLAISRPRLDRIIRKYGIEVQRR